MTRTSETGHTKRDVENDRDDASEIPKSRTESERRAPLRIDANCAVNLDYLSNYSSSIGPPSPLFSLSPPSSSLSIEETESQDDVGGFISMDVPTLNMPPPSISISMMEDVIPPQS